MASETNPPVNQPTPPAPMAPPPGMPPIYIQFPKQGRGTKIILIIVVLLLLGSIAINLSLMAAVAMFTGTGPFATRVVQEGEKDQTIAVYNIVGAIDDRQAAMFRRFVKHAIEDEDIKAVVLRVDSPGGGVSSSDQMNSKVRELVASRKNVVVSMGGMAASGGYYVSVPAEKIYAEPTTVTGSIGVIAMMPILKGTMEKIGAEIVILRSDKARDNKALLNPFEEPNERGRQQMLDLLNAMQARFEDAVFDGRKSVLSRAEVDAVSNGETYLAEQAKKLRLIDEIGYLDDAIDEAARLAGLGDPHVVRYDRRAGLFEQIAGEANVNVDVDLDPFDNDQTPRILMLWRGD